LALKKKYILYIVLLYSFLFSAQFNVDSFTRMDNDLRARRESVKDINGDETALIKVRTDIDFLQFESALYPAQIEKRIGEYFIFLSPGDRKISFLREGFKRHDYYFPEKIKSGLVYYLDLSGLGTTLNSEVLAVTIQTEPKGARIYLDGKYLEYTEQIKATVGKHDLRVIQSGYRILERKINISAERTFFMFRLKKQEDALISINSKPEGADIYLDDVNIGKTPITSFYPAGRFKIHIRKEMYEPVSTYINIRNPRTCKMYTLNDIRATLTINTYLNAIVFLNGDKLQNLKNMKVNPQICDLKIVLNNEVIMEKRIILKKNEKRVLDLYPEIEKGSIQISVIPKDASIELFNGNRQVYDTEDSAVLKDIPVGIYDLKITQKGYRSHFSEIEVANGRLSQKIIRLENGSDIGGEFVFVEGGFFKMGNGSGGSDENPEHDVKVRSIFVGKYEVTQEEWETVMGSNPSKFDGGWFSNNDNYPVENISWYDAVKFCNKRSQMENYSLCYTIIDDYVKCDFNADGYRLPTEVEWEYVASGGNICDLYRK